MKTNNLKYLPFLLVGALGTTIAVGTACSSSSGSGGATTTATVSGATVTTGAMTTTSVTSSTTTVTSTVTSTSTGTMFPTPPTIGAEIDRMGRPAINTALNASFVAAGNAKTAAKDAYNDNKDPTTWKAGFQTEFQNNLGILDAIDGVCGNQLGAAAGAASATTYSVLAGAFTDDRLYLDTSVATCTAYLGVELKALGVTATADCGGRKLDYKVLDITYAAVSGLAGASNGIMANDVAFLAAFPYEAAPH